MILAPSSDSQLIKSYVAGNEDAFAQLLHRHQEAIFKFIYLPTTSFKRLSLK
jgi:hypothetical protein